MKIRLGLTLLQCLTQKHLRLILYARPYTNEIYKYTNLICTVLFRKDFLPLTIKQQLKELMG